MSQPEPPPLPGPTPWSTAPQPGITAPDSPPPRDAVASRPIAPPAWGGPTFSPPQTFTAPQFSGYPPGASPRTYYQPAGYPGYPMYPPGYYAPYPYAYLPPPRPPRDTYRLVVSIISIVALSLLLLVGIFLALIDLLGFASPSSVLRDSLAGIAFLVLTTGLALGGGGIGLYMAIRATLGRPSAPLRLPHFLIPLGLLIAVFATAIISYDFNYTGGLAYYQALLLLMAAILPALTILMLTAQRLGYPSTWRHIWMSVLGGVFLATFAASILELVAEAVAAAYLRIGTFSATTNQPTDTKTLIFTLLVYSVIAPLAEEGLKPVGPLIILGRIRNPAEAFMLGMSAGIGFAILETTLYISSAQADWVLVAVGRLGAGLIHGIGSGMATLGWYYLFRGRGVSHRYLKGCGALLYAVAQHGTWNGLSVLLPMATGPLGQFLNIPTWFFGLPTTVSDDIVLAIYAILVGVLLLVTRQLAQKPTTTDTSAQAFMANGQQPQAAISSATLAPHPQDIGVQR